MRYSPVLLVTLFISLQSHASVKKVSGAYKLFIKGKVGVYSSNLGQNTHLSNNFNSFILGGAIGKKITPAFHLDLEFNYRNSKNTKFFNLASQETAYKEWQVGAQTLLLNGNYHFLVSSVINPYIKGGLGISRNISGIHYSRSFNNSSVTYSPGKTTITSAWQVGGGISMRHNNRIKSELEYSYLNRGKSKTQNFTLTEVAGQIQRKEGGQKTQIIKDHILTYGIVYSF